MTHNNLETRHRIADKTTALQITRKSEIELPLSIDQSPTDGLTVQAWIMPSLPESVAVSTETEITLLHDNSNAVLALDIVPPEIPIAPPSLSFGGQELRPGRWHHVARSFDGRKAHQFVDGRLVNTDEVSIPKVGGGWILYGLELPKGYKCVVSQIVVSSGALDGPTIAAHRYSQPDAGDPNLLECWPLDGKGDDPIKGLKTDENTELSGETWVNAKLPPSLLETSLAQKAITLARARANAAEQESHRKSQEKIKKRHQQAEAALHEAHQDAEALAHAARIRIQAIRGGRRSDIGLVGDEAYERNPNSYKIFRELVCAPSIERLDAYTAFHSSGIVSGRSWSEELYSNWSFDLPIYALALDPSGWDGEPVLLRLMGDGRIYRGKCSESDGKENHHVLCIAPSFDGSAEWSMTVDVKNRRLLGSNGREIWSCDISQGPDSHLAATAILVPHGESPNPIALTVHDQTGDLFWIDRELEMVRTAKSDGSDVRDLYKAPNPRPGIALDYAGVSDPPADQPTDLEPDMARLYWNADVYRWPMIVDDPGLFFWLQLPGLSQGVGPAMGDIPLGRAKWIGGDSTVRDGVKWDLNAAVLNVYYGPVDLGVNLVDCEKGFSIHLYLKDRISRRGDCNPQTLVSLGNENSVDNITLAQDENDQLVFAVGRSKLVSERPWFGSDGWCSISASVDQSGVGAIIINGKEFAKGDLHLPAAIVRTRNYFGRGFRGYLGVLRLWNRTLSEDEIADFHRHPFRQPTGPIATCHRGSVDCPDAARPYLMSGRIDGSSAPHPLFEFTTDKGLSIESEASSARAKLLAARQGKMAAERDAAARRRRAHEEESARKAQAFEDSRTNLEKARKLAEEAQKAQARIRDKQRADVARAKINRKNRIDKARAKKAKAIRDAKDEKRRRIAAAYAYGLYLKANANKKMQEAQKTHARKLQIDQMRSFSPFGI